MLAVQSVTQHRNPIELQTENGFSIVRVCELTQCVPAGACGHRFLVRDPDGFELEIIVEIAEKLARALTKGSRSCLSSNSSYWIYCAERHLAGYLWENGDYPPDARLLVDRPTLDDINLAVRWETQSPDL